MLLECRIALFWKVDIDSLKVKVTLSSQANDGVPTSTEHRILQELWNNKNNNGFRKVAVY